MCTVSMLRFFFIPWIMLGYTCNSAYSYDIDNVGSKGEIYFMVLETMLRAVEMCYTITYILKQLL